MVSHIDGVSVCSQNILYIYFFTVEEGRGSKTIKLTIGEHRRTKIFQDTSSPSSAARLNDEQRVVVGGGNGELKMCLPLCGCCNWA